MIVINTQLNKVNNTATATLYRDLNKVRYSLALWQQFNLGKYMCCCYRMHDFISLVCSEIDYSSLFTTLYDSWGRFTEHQCPKQ